MVPAVSATRKIVMVSVSILCVGTRDEAEMLHCAELHLLVVFVASPA